MANDEHVKRLKAGTDAWNLWRRENPDVTPDLSEADLREAILHGADLSGAKLSDANLGYALLIRANLSKADLVGADLSSAELGGADLSEANLRGADFIGAKLAAVYVVGADEPNLNAANLSGADLSEAYLIRADLSGTDLSEANLRRAILSAADLDGADVTGADLSEATCFSTSFSDVDLSTAKGLEYVKHAGPSSVGIDTLYKSKGKIPDEFLRGCGLSDWEVENVKLYDPDLRSNEIIDVHQRVFELLSDAPIQVSPVFISYSRTDTKFVDTLVEKLDELRIRYWRDKDHATAGRLDKVIDRGIQLNRTVLLILSENSVNSPWVEYEVGRAVDLSRELERDVLCPIALDDSWAMSTQMSGQLRNQIKKYSVLNFEDWSNQDSFEREMKKLIDGLHLHYRNSANDSVEPERE